MSAETHSDQIVMRILTAACTGAGAASPLDWGLHWMKRLTDAFEVEYPGQVISRERGGLTIGWLTKTELLFDILVAGWDETACRIDGAKNTYPRLKLPLWAVESEMATKAPEILFDFNKLLLAAVPHRLLVTKNRGKPKDRHRSNLRFTNFLRDAAQGHDVRAIHVAYIPSFNESPSRNRRASAEWLIEGGDVPFEVHTIRGGAVASVFPGNAPPATGT